MPSHTIHVLSLALCLSSGFQQGYIASVLNQPYKEIEGYINTSWTHLFGSPMTSQTLNVVWSLLIVCFPIATIFGQFAAQILVNHCGRKRTAIIACLLYLPGTLLSAAARWIPDSFYLLFLGRIVWSLANGIASVNATVWIVECAPPATRGRMAACQEFFMAFGSLMTQALGVPFSTETLWEFMFIPNTMVAVVNLTLFTCVYESPQYLIEKKMDYEQARLALSKYHGISYDHPAIDREIKVCEEAIHKKLERKLSRKLSKKLSAESVANDTGPSALAIMFNPWRANDDASKVIRQNAWVGLMVKVAYVFTGARCLRSYSSFLLYELGGWTLQEANLGSLLIGILRLPVTLVPVFLVDRVGRRPLILGSTCISLIALVGMHFAIVMGPEWKILTLLSLTVLLLVNACGLGSISRFYCAEVVPRSILLQSVSVLTQLEAISKIAVEFAFFPIANEVGATSLLMFSVPTAFLLFAMWDLCPETSRRTVNEVLNNVAQRKGISFTF